MSAASCWLHTTPDQQVELRRLADINIVEGLVAFGLAAHRALDLLDLLDRARVGDQLALRNLDHGLASMRAALRSRRQP